MQMSSNRIKYQSYSFVKKHFTVMKTQRQVLDNKTNISDQRRKLLRFDSGFCAWMWVWWEIWETLDWVDAATLASEIFVSGTFSPGDPYLSARSHTHANTKTFTHIHIYVSTHEHKQSLYVCNTQTHTHSTPSSTALLNTMAPLCWQLNWKRA